MSNHLSVSDTERAGRSAQPSLSAHPVGHLSDGDLVQIAVPERSLPHCDWCAAVDYYLAARREAHYDEWLQTLREQAEERTR